MAHQENGVHQKDGKPERTATAFVPKRSVSGCRARVLEQYEKAVQKWKPSENFARTAFFEDRESLTPTQKQTQT